jgi:3'-phosphoadenosine 5'-phosphosulfate sulfotransferase (PAPS reductase)/FAD synthetase
MADYTAPKEINRLIARKALFIVNHSGGKDSQAMTIKLRRLVPASQLLVIHADLPGVDWDGCFDLVTDTCSDLIVTQVVAGKTFFDMVERRKMFPSPKYRQCTSDLKRDPITKAIRHYIKDNGLDGLIVNCMGLRAEESPGRAKGKVFTLNKRNSKAGREWYDYSPIHNWTEVEVYAEILNAGEAVHWAYHMGMDRLSCQFCIMASTEDLKVAAKLAPENYKKIVDLEKKINYTMIMPRKNSEPRFLEEITGIKA